MLYLYLLLCIKKENVLLILFLIYLLKKVTLTQHIRWSLNNKNNMAEVTASMT